MGWEIELFTLERDSIVHNARNIIASKFLSSDATDLVWLDDDVGVGAGVLTRLMTHRVDFMVAGYRAKMDEEKYVINWPNGVAPVLEDDSPPVEVWDSTIGIARMSRDCLERMKAPVEKYWYTVPYAPDLTIYPLFDTEVADHVFVGEDFYFCRRWRAMGGQIWIDPEIQSVHIKADGTIYPGCLGNWLRKQNADHRAGDTGKTGIVAANDRSDDLQSAAD